MSGVWVRGSDVKLKRAWAHFNLNQCLIEGNRKHTRFRYLVAENVCSFQLSFPLALQIAQPKLSHLMINCWWTNIPKWCHFTDTFMYLPRSKSDGWYVRFVVFCACFYSQTHSWNVDTHANIHSKPLALQHYMKHDEWNKQTTTDRKTCVCVCVFVAAMEVAGKWVNAAFFPTGIGDL